PRRPAVFLASPPGARGQNGFKSSIYDHNAVLQHDRRAADFRRRRPNRPPFRSARSRKCGKANGRTMIEPGVYRYPRMDRVAFGRPWEQVLAEEVERLGASRVFAIAGSTLAATVPLAAAMREALGERLAGFTDVVKRLKEGFFHPEMIPQAVILDPRITPHTRMRLWLSTGIRAVDHAVETLCSIHPQPLFEATSAHALRLLPQGLIRTKRDPADLEARLESMLGVWLSLIG